VLCVHETSRITTWFPAVDRGWSPHAQRPRPRRRRPRRRRSPCALGRGQQPRRSLRHAQTLAAGGARAIPAGASTAAVPPRAARGPKFRRREQWCPWRRRQRQWPTSTARAVVVAVLLSLLLLLMLFLLFLSQLMCPCQFRIPYCSLVIETMMMLQAPTGALVAAGGGRASARGRGSARPTQRQHDPSRPG
jgi:hypothetical protein